MIDNRYGKDYHEDEKNLLKTFLDTYMLPGVNSENQEWRDGEFVEIIMNPTCNQNCSYCYIARYGHELYPAHTRADADTQAHNFELLINYFFERKIMIRAWEIYGGDLFHDEIFWKILDIFYEKYKYLYENQKYLFESPNDDRPIEIIVPNNLSYFYNQEVQNKFYEYRDRLYKEAHIVIGLSWSTDGAFAVDDREKRVLPDDYWDVMFKFARSVNAGVHPMIAPENIENWIQNYDWWMEMFRKYNFDDSDEHFQPPMLEVRNDEWTDERIQHYRNLIKHIFIKRFEMNDNDVYKMARHYFVGDGREGSLPHAPQMDPIGFDASPKVGHNERMSCSIQEQLHIVLSDLSIVPCHRTSYPFMKAGHFIVENDKIIDIKPHNVALFIEIVSTPVNMLPKCFNCVYKNVCMRGCFGAQYEASGEIFMPAESVCKMLGSKFDLLIQLLNEYGVLQCAIDNNFIPDSQKSYYFSRSEEMGYKLNG